MGADGSCWGVLSGTPPVREERVGGLAGVSWVFCPHWLWGGGSSPLFHPVAVSSQNVPNPGAQLPGFSSSPGTLFFRLCWNEHFFCSCLSHCCLLLIFFFFDKR